MRSNCRGPNRSKGEYDLVLRWTPGRKEQVTDRTAFLDAPNIFTELKEHFGLKTQTGKMHETIYIIESLNTP